MIKLLSLILVLSSFQTYAETVDLTQPLNGKLINNKVTILRDSSGLLTVNDAINIHQQGAFKENKSGKVSFGVTKDTIWFSLSLSNTKNVAIEKYLQINTAWLDKAEIHVIRNNKVVQTQLTGDAYPFDKRQLKERRLTTHHEFAPGNTLLLIRMASQDPFIAPIYLLDQNAYDEERVYLAYFYGFIYGAFLILLFYTLIISISLKDKGYFLYFLYLFSFTVFNYSYTGHGFKYLWSNSQFSQQWLMYVSMFTYVFFGVMFTFEFLKLKTYIPKLYECRRKIYATLIFLIISGTLIFDRIFTGIFNLLLVSSLSFFMLVMGIFALKNGYKMARFILPAILMGAGGATIAGLTTLGAIPYSKTLFHIVEIGMVLEMSILAFALSFNLKESEDARILAEIHSQQDHLTKLYNRRGFINRVEPLWNSGIKNNKSMSIILLDIDWFKSVNDNYGHAVGDKVLEEIAKILKVSIRDGDIISRWGGEEFIIFLPDANLIAAQQVAEKVRELIEKAVISLESISINITASFGAASSTDDNTPIEELINSADTLLYQAKENGRNCVHVG